MYYKHLLNAVALLASLAIAAPISGVADVSQDLTKRIRYCHLPDLYTDCVWPIPERRDVANRPRPCNPPTLITGCEWPTKKRDDVSDLSFIEGPQDLEKRLRPCNPPTLIRGCEWPTEKRDDILDLESSIGQLKGRTPESPDSGDVADLVIPKPREVVFPTPCGRKTCPGFTGP